MSGVACSPRTDVPTHMVTRVIDLVEKHLGREWLQGAVDLTPETRFDRLGFDALDQFAVQQRIERAFAIPFPPSLPLPETIGGLAAFVERGLERQRRLTIARNFFARGWRQVAKADVFREAALLGEIRRHAPRAPLDIGCGDNLFASRLPGLVGIDIANPRAHRVTDLLDYRHFRAHDLVLALGSINFGDADDVLDDLVHTRALMTEGGVIHMRVNPGIRWPQCPELPIFPWSVDTIHALGERAGLEVDTPIATVEGAHGPRMLFRYRAVPQRFA